MVEKFHLLEDHSNMFLDRVNHNYLSGLVSFLLIFCGIINSAFVYRYHVVAPQAGLVPTSDATLINGLGRYAGGPTSPLSVITVLPNKRYRFRLVSISCDPNFKFSIDGHTLVSKNL